MPLVRRRLRQRTTRSLTELDTNTLLSLVNGYRRRCDDTNNIGLSLDEALELYESNRDELNQPFVPGRLKLLDTKPCRRFWCVWKFDLLTQEPRQRVVDDSSLPDTSDEMLRPFAELWQSPDGYESSYRYLNRRGLLSAAELRAVREPAFVAGERHKLDFWRNAPSYYPEPREPHFQPWELADAMLACDPTGKHKLLTPDELERAEPYL